MASYRDVEMLSGSMQSLTDTLLKKRMMEQQERERAAQERERQAEIERQIKRDEANARASSANAQSTADYRKSMLGLREREIAAKENPAAGAAKAARITQKWTTTGKDLMEVVGTPEQLRDAAFQIYQQTGKEPQPYVEPDKPEAEKRPVTVSYTDENGLQVNLQLTETQAQQMIPGINQPKGAAKPTPEPMVDVTTKIDDTQTINRKMSKAEFDLGMEKKALDTEIKNIDAQLAQLRPQAVNNPGASKQLQELAGRKIGLTKAYLEKKAALERGQSPAPSGTPAPAAASTPEPSGTPKVGDIRKGYRFLGGNPAEPKSWQKIQQ